MDDFCAHDRGACTDTRPVAGPTARAFPLSDDVLICALEVLGLSDLRSAAGVSRQFYAAAWRSGLYLHRSNHGIFNSADPHLVNGEAASWNALVDHALRKGLRLGFTLVGASSVATPAAFYRASLQKLLCAIARSLPILVTLSVTIEVGGYPDLCAALQKPAPCLRSLVIRSCAYQDAPLGPINLSSGLFSGSCPVLHELGLDCRSLGHEPVPAFSNVVRLSTWRCEMARQLLVARHFPMLRHLMVSSDDGARDMAPPQLNLCGIALRSLALHDVASQRFTPLAERTLTVPGLPMFHCLIEDHNRMAWNDPLGWPCRESDGGAIDMHITSKRNVEANCRYASASGAWRRSYLFKFLLSPAAPYGLPGLASQLSYLRMDDAMLRGLLNCAVELAALQRLRVDISSWKSDVAVSQDSPLTVRLVWDRQLSNSVPRLRFPILASVAILWHTAAPQGPVKLDRESVLCIGRALVTDAKPVLELGGIDREHPLCLSDCAPGQDAADDIDSVFSSVQRVPCAVGVLLDQFDGDLWNDNVAVETDRYLSQSLAW